MKAFKAYDIRGIYNQDFDKEDVYRIGYFLPELLETDRVLVGYDGRTSSDEIFTALAAGINDQGADVYDIGLATTPMVYYATAEYNFAASVQITASHNPPEYNGLKVSRTGAMPVGYETGLRELESMIEKRKISKANDRGGIYKLNVKDKYIKFLKRFLPDIKKLTIAVDCSNGMAALVIKDILGEAPVYLYDKIDCTFPNHAPNPLIEENVRDLKETVKAKGCDLGIIFDGDGDRVMFVDEKGRFISPDLIIAVMANYFLKGQGEIVLHDIRTSKAVSEYIEDKGGKTFMWKVGHAFAKKKLREIDGIYGGELAGHYYFRDFFYCDSGILASLIVLNVLTSLKDKRTTFSGLIDSIKKYSFSGEINFRVAAKIEVMEDIKKYFTEKEDVVAFYDFDGYRLEFEDWWFNIRPSNTEPYLRLVVEAKTDNLLQKKIDVIEKRIKIYK